MPDASVQFQANGYTKGYSVKFDEYLAGYISSKHSPIMDISPAMSPTIFYG